MIFDIQKASLTKRFSAWLLDVILLAVLAVGIGAVLSNVFGYDTYAEKIDAAYEKYEKQYGVQFDIDYETYTSFTPAEKENYDAAQKALSQDQEAMQAYSMVLILTMAILTLGLLGGYLILEFFVPLYLKNGQTVGKKVFGIALMRKDSVKVTPLMMFVRTVLGKFALETMIPALVIIMLMFNIAGLFSVLLIGLILLAQVILLFANKNHCVIHDLMACTIPVDLSSQMIFDSPEALLDYKKQHHAEQVARQDY